MVNQASTFRPVMTQVNLKLLHIFIAIAETRSFRQASELLNRSQSAVSMQMKQLEEQIGVTLFHRTTRRVELTTEGIMLLGFARRALEEWKNGLVEIREAVDMQRGTLSFGCIPTIAATVLPRILRNFQTNYPGISISLRELTAEELLESIRRKEVDFGIGVRTDRSTEFNFENLFEEPIYAIATSAFPLKARLDLAELSKYPLLLNSSSTALRRLLDRSFAARDLPMNIKFEVAHTHTLTALAIAGLGVGILPKIAIPPLARKRFQSVPIVNPVLTRTIAIIALKGRSLSPAAQALTQTIARTRR